jgi:type VI secretion system protein ImpL
MNAIARARESSPDGSVPQNLKDQFGAVVNQLQVDAARKPPPFNTLLAKLAQDSTDMIRSLRDRLNAQWKAAQIAAFFQDNLKGRYPLVRSSIQWSGAGPGGGARRALLSRPTPFNGLARALATPVSRTQPGPPDATLAAFGRFFGPNGLMDSFFKQHLQPYVDTRKGGWRWRGPAGPEQSIPPEALQAFPARRRRARRPVRRQQPNAHGPLSVDARSNQRRCRPTS